MGIEGPYGTAFLPIDNEQFIIDDKDINENYPAWNLPYFNTPKLQLPHQYDGYNCGVACIVFMLDFMLTQYDIMHTYHAFSIKDMGAWHKFRQTPIN